jgi:tetratricopeptide (TPR) repeat protein
MPMLSHQSRAVESSVAIWTVLVLLPGTVAGLTQGGPGQEITRIQRRTDLRPVPLPPLDSLETSVAEQLRTTNASLVTAIEGPSTTPSDLAELFGTMGELYQAYELYSSAELCYLNALGLSGERFRWLYLLGRAVQEQGRLEEGVSWLQRAQALEPGNVPCLVNTANALLGLNRLEDAERHYRKALELSPSCGAAYFGLGDLALKRNQFQEAVSALTRALEIVPGANRIHYLMAMAYRGLGDAEKGKEHLRQSGSVGVRIDDPLQNELEGLLRGERIFLLRGRLAYNAGRYQDAANEFRQAVAGNPKNCGANINLASALGAMGDDSSALTVYQQAVPLCGDNAVLHFNLAQLLARGKRIPEAIEHYETCLKIHPGDKETHLAIGRLLTEQGQTDRAVNHLREALGLDRASEEAWFELSAALTTGGHFREALQTVEEGLGVLPQAGRLMHLKARILAACPDASLRNGPRALELASVVYDAAPTVRHAETLALALAEVGRCSEAAQIARQAIQVLRKEGVQARLLASLESDLVRYEKGPPCRVPPPEEGQRGKGPDGQ